MSSIADGFVQNGCDVVKFDELTHTIEKFLELTINSNFDYLVGYDFSALKLKIDNNIKIPVINYFSDEIDKPTAGEGFVEYKKHLNNPDSYTFYWDKVLFEKNKKDIKNLFYMPHFVNTNLYKPMGIKPQFDVMFAGRLDTDYRLNFLMYLIKSLPNIKFAWYAIEKHYKDAISRLTKSEAQLLQKVYQNFIDNESDMATAINNSKIIINMHSQGVSSFNYRTFQTMACEKLVLSDYRTEAKELFTEWDLAFYKDKNDAKEKILHYLFNEVNYNEIIKNARARICLNHDAKTCVAKMIKLIQN